jgi:hypothetical protein
VTIRLLAVGLLGSFFFVAQAQAHGGVSLDQGQCIMKLGPDTMSFTGYQPQKSREQFCDDIPDVGPTIIVLDAQQDELRDMAIEMRILRDVGQKDDNENVEQNTETFVPARKYKTGTLNFEHTFPNKGKFIGLVRAVSDDGQKVYVSRFPFSVGETLSRDLIVYVFFSVLGLVAFGLVFRNMGKKTAR